MRVYDCFTFFNELDLLEIRLNELDPVVDYFVLVEATKTFSGKQKPLYYNENRKLFSQFSDRIIHVVVDDMPTVINNNRWPLETFQRKCIWRGLHSCVSNDIVLISDVDEIPTAALVKDFCNTIVHPSIIEMAREWLCKQINNTSNFSGNHYIRSFLGKMITILSPKSRIVKVYHKHYEYYLNGYVMDRLPGTSMMQFSTLINVLNADPDNARWLRGIPHIYQYGGWHFSYLGGVDKIIYKIKSFSHSEFDTERYTDAEKIEKLMEGGSNLYGKNGKGHNITYVEIDETYPVFVQEKCERLKKYIKELQIE